MNQPLVSVLMTAYNREKYIADAIKSVISQSYHNWELIITDDQSKDRTLEIARSFENKDSRIHVYVNEKNLGDYPNRNKAASYANGKYLKYLDADDILYPWALEILVSMMENNPEAKIGLCSNSKDILPKVISPEEAYIRHYTGIDYIFARSPLTVIMDRQAFFDVGCFSGHQHVGDFELWNTMCRQYKTLLIPFGWCWYRVHDEQQSLDNRIDPFVPYKYIKLSVGFINANDCPLNIRYKKKVLNEINRQAYKSLIATLVSGKISSFIKMWHLYHP